MAHWTTPLGSPARWPRTGRGVQAGGSPAPRRPALAPPCGWRSAGEVLFLAPLRSWARGRPRVAVAQRTLHVPPLGRRHPHPASSPGGWSPRQRQEFGTRSAGRYGEVAMALPADRPHAARLKRLVRASAWFMGVLEAARA